MIYRETNSPTPPLGEMGENIRCRSADRTIVLGCGLLGSQVAVYLTGDLQSVGNGTHHQGRSFGGIAGHKHVFSKLGLLGLEESHGQQHHLGLDDLGLAHGLHDGTAALGVGLPGYLLHLHAGELSVLAQELQ